jgi:hypothetical protein
MTVALAMPRPSGLSWRPVSEANTASITVARRAGRFRLAVAVPEVMV